MLAVGRLKPGPEAALFAQHNARLRPPLAVKEIPEARGSAAEIRRREGAALLAALPEGALAVAMDLGGATPDSEELAALSAKWEESGRQLAFLIGGAEGLDPSVLARAEYRLSLGRLTWPHFLVRGLLAEQLYRAQAIRTGHPYHRAWRPG
ncbi:23S rRNA (pseudouridine(1915)-N(3))-methyltransferase RlmH [Roseomonas marmotae]|uniref:Ribosomal RNA large subunit methyltransferase H n=1 Tax=Roseomonas marmotae TaxID=2768161 RepID=A0ABS3K6X8_9PROT|nr:23S rRNA (pseudouridine(1915)-N(3))-methyltransferase RlmH [Roseomonas marmotae]MBO1073209.1 23S rRNA (pseudouridine(1915)-N(3))-methyltransferase RlmH [Roseomonas marmotae]QTI81040.1 23S rRNA (pseudouridine(1915)-N(3))-methyltransferase RlmH [Roseomonas marmotae]